MYTYYNDGKGYNVDIMRREGHAPIVSDYRNDGNRSEYSDDEQRKVWRFVPDASGMGGTWRQF